MARCTGSFNAIGDDAQIPAGAARMGKLPWPTTAPEVRTFRVVSWGVEDGSQYVTEIAELDCPAGYNCRRLLARWVDPQYRVTIQLHG